MRGGKKKEERKGERKKEKELDLRIEVVSGQSKNKTKKAQAGNEWSNISKILAIKEATTTTSERTFDSSGFSAEGTDFAFAVPHYGASLGHWPVIAGCGVRRWFECDRTRQFQPLDHRLSEVRKPNLPTP